MQKIGKLGHAAQVIGLCLPPVVMSLIGLTALSRRKGAAVMAGRKTPPAVRSKRAPRGSL